MIDLFTYADLHRGKTYIPQHDRKRLAAQYMRVFELMQDSQWRTLAEIEAITHDPQASISARLREIRHNSYIVDRRRRGDPKRGLHEYRVTV
jgi:hypothetical protein